MSNMSSKTRFSLIVLSIILMLVLVLSFVSCSSSSTTNVTPEPAQSTPAVSPAAPPAPTSAAVPEPSDPTLLLASTTSTRDSGLMDAHNNTNFPGWPWEGLIPLFQQRTGYVVKPSYVGTGAALTMGQQGNADVLLVHAPPSEVTFVQQGYGIDRRLVMHNDFIIVGPLSDPAKISGMTSATEALKKIAASGTKFYSRGDNSGTDQLEKSLWTKIGITVKDGSSSNPGWYIEGGAGTGMLTLLQIADEKGGYSLTDRATYLANQKKLTSNIDIQGDPLLLNIYHVITVNPDKWPNTNVLGARAFADFITSPQIQSLISTYGVAQYGSPLFFADYGKTEASLNSQ